MGKESDTCHKEKGEDSKEKVSRNPYCYISIKFRWDLACATLPTRRQLIKFHFTIDVN